MRHIFMDESGSLRGDWKRGIDEQPFYVLSGVVLPSDHIGEATDWTRRQLDHLVPAKVAGRLAAGFEFKAKEVAKEKGPNDPRRGDRALIRDTYFSIPGRFGGTAILVVIDKREFLDEGATWMGTPATYAVRLLFERVGKHLERVRDRGSVIYDDPPDQKMFRDAVRDLLNNGSRVVFPNSKTGWSTETVQPIDRIDLVTEGDSRDSLGLQVADHVAHFGYRYFRDGCNAACGWWQTLEAALDQPNGSLLGCGLKVQPQRAEAQYRKLHAARRLGRRASLLPF